MSKMPTFQNLMSAGLFLCALAVVAMMARREFGSSSLGGPTASFHPVEAWPEVAGDGDRLGPTDPVMLIVEFVDFECPACRAFEDSVLRPFLAEHRSEVALLVRQWPLDYHRLARPMAVAAMCAGEVQRFEDFYRFAFEQWKGAEVPSVDELLATVGGDAEGEFRECLARPGVDDRVARDTELGRRIGGTGTPTLVVEGQLVTGIPTTDDLEAMLARARSVRE